MCDTEFCTVQRISNGCSCYGTLQEEKYKDMDSYLIISSFFFFFFLMFVLFLDHSPYFQTHISVINLYIGSEFIVSVNDSKFNV
jgi:hypothetical protein